MAQRKKLLVRKRAGVWWVRFETKATGRLAWIPVASWRHAMDIANFVAGQP